MTSTYRDAAITIAATTATDSTKSLYSYTSPESWGKEVDTHSGTQIIRSPLPHPDWTQDTPNTGSDCFIFPLLYRGWVFQERLLSSRTLHFAKDELVWECMTTTSCECTRGQEYSDMIKYIYSINVHPDLEDELTISHLKTRVSNSWHALIERYTGLGLTYQRDRLIAIAGVAKLFGTSHGELLGDYLGGLWSKTMDVDLAWRKIESGGSKEDISPRPLLASAPSWAWTSVSGKVKFGYIARRDVRSHINILKYNMGGTGPDQYGQLRSGLLVVEGVAVKGLVIYGTGLKRIFRVAGNWGSKGKNFFPDYEFDRPGEGFVASGSKVLCLKLYESFNWLYCLIIRCVNVEKGHYERLGMLAEFRFRLFSGIFVRNDRHAKKMNLSLV